MKMMINAATTAVVGVSAVALVAGGAMTAAPKSAHALYKKCQSQAISGTGGRKLSNLFAKSSARSAWRATAHATHSKRWSKWMLAKGKTISCQKSRRKWRCVASARPCIVPL
jgi:Mn2+/Fe2+ NRAMP family transporter